MLQKSEIVVLKPTTVFLSFLVSQLPEDLLPSLKLLQTDNTAYIIPKQHSDEDTLVELEKNFTRMFRYEIRRWLGAAARNDIENNFFDFLCCFKFELHSHLIDMEKKLASGQYVIKIKPRSVLRQWIAEEVAADEVLSDVMEHVTLSQLAENATLLIKKFANVHHIKSFLHQYYRPIFTTAMSRMSNQPDTWPEINSWQAFNRYFAVEIHTHLVDLRS